MYKWLSIGTIETYYYFQCQIYWTKKSDPHRRRNHLRSRTLSYSKSFHAYIFITFISIKKWIPNPIPENWKGSFYEFCWYFCNDSNVLNVFISKRVTLWLTLVSDKYWYPHRRVNRKSLSEDRKILPFQFRRMKFTWRLNLRLSWPRSLGLGRWWVRRETKLTPFWSETELWQSSKQTWYTPSYR